MTVPQPQPATSNNTDDVNLAAIRAKYTEEREKRTREDGVSQYQQTKEAAFQHYAKDPYVEPLTRDAFPALETEVLIIGAGFGGLLAAIQLLKRGITDFRIIDRAGDFGGTWYWNRYPGIACDVESYIYLPMLEETGFIPSQKYAPGPEIFKYTQLLAKKFELYPKAIFQTAVESLLWMERDQLWAVSTNRGDSIKARFVVGALGPLNNPQLPAIPGIKDFQGHSFHTSRWDYDYTGGSREGGPLEKLAGKRVAIIGTGASAIQAVPHLGASAGHLFVFQRTPSSVGVRANSATDPEWAAQLPAGWQQERMDNFSKILGGIPQPKDLVSDGWTELFTELLKAAGPDAPADKTPEERVLEMEASDILSMKKIHTRIDQTVADPTTAAGLKPWYNIMCKRPCFHDEYLDTFNRANVTLVDTQGKGVDRITATGLVVGEQEYPVDCIIYATGFEWGMFLSDHLHMDVQGRKGLTLKEHWKDGLRTQHGVATHGFPNYFLSAAPQSGFCPNFTHMTAEHMKHIAYIISEVSKLEAGTAEVTAEAEEAWTRTVVELARPRQAFFKACTPGYYNNEGQYTDKALQNSMYSPGFGPFIKILEAWREKGGLPGFFVE